MSGRKRMFERLGAIEGATPPERDRLADAALARLHAALMSRAHGEELTSPARMALLQRCAAGDDVPGLELDEEERAALARWARRVGVDDGGRAYARALSDLLTAI